MKWFAERAIIDGALRRDVLLEIEGGRFTTISADAEPGDAQRLPGVVLPGFANAHSHAFHRALRGRTHGDGGTFWTWREAMYSVATKLDPDSYLALARATYAEMALSGITTVGEFHYLHHASGGQHYDDPNAMAEALRQAAAEAGIRLTLLDTCYLAGGLEPSGHTPLSLPQRRFGDGTAAAWAERVGQLTPSSGMRIGAAIHSVRAVPKQDLATVAAVADGRPLHLHLSEQPAENIACQAYYGCSPTELLDGQGVLGATTTAVHAIHLNDGDIATLGRTGTTICCCPTTERDLADGLGPAAALREAGSRLSLGTDQQAVTDLIEEARAVELHERLASGQRGRLSQGDLLAALIDHASLGWPEVAGLQVGAVADLVAVRLDTVRTAGSAPDQLLMSASAADVDTVLVGGQVVVRDGQHQLGDVAALLDAAISPLWDGA
jgi:formiminoglutamate deiminase